MKNVNVSKFFFLILVNHFINVNQLNSVTLFAMDAVRNEYINLSEFILKCFGIWDLCYFIIIIVSVIGSTICASKYFRCVNPCTVTNI